MSRRAGRKGKERREARRQRDREWVKLQLTIMKLAGVDEGTYNHMEKFSYTKGALQGQLRIRFGLTDLRHKPSKDKNPQSEYQRYLWEKFFADLNSSTPAA